MAGAPARLTDAQKAHVKRVHAIVDVLARMGIDPPPYWDGASNYRVRAAALGFPYGRDDSQGVLIKASENRWWAFHGGFGGDVLDLVRRVTGTNSLTDAARILESRGPIPITRSTVGPGSAAAIGTAAIAGTKKPGLRRTRVDRVREVNAEAWRYLTLPKLAERARAYLRGRGIDLTALETEVGQPLAGHAPASRTGLVDHLRGTGLSDAEIVDSGWGVRRPGEDLRDRYHHRVLLPFRDEQHRVVGVTGRDVTGRATAKYLNHPTTLTFDKSSVLYRPSTPQLDEHATVIACEGTLDALAITAAAARVGASHRFAPVTQSGLSLTDQVAPRIFALNPRPPILCGDGDEAGQKATAAWVERAMRVYHREVLTLTLPDGMDPADWLQREGDLGLVTFSRAGCIDDDGYVRAQPAGGLLARRELERAMQIARTTNPDVQTAMVAPIVLDRLGKRAAQLGDEAAIHRFAVSAGKALAELADGMGAGGRARQVIDAARRHAEMGHRPPVPPLVTEPRPAGRMR